MTHTAIFWDKIAERYSKKPVVDEAAYQKKLRVTRVYLHSDMHVLEIGCGTGSTAIAHAPFVKQLRATDISPKMIEIANEKASVEKIENVSFEVSSIDGLDVAEGSLDAVLALSVLHLLEDKDMAIAKLHKMLRKDGVFITSTACLGDMMWIFKLIVPVAKFFRLIPVLKVFTQESLTKSMTKAGFDIDYKWQPSKKAAVFMVARKIA